MVKKVQKIKQKKNTVENKKNGFKFGRNLGSFLIVISGLVLLFFMIFIPYSYISAYTANKKVPFEGKENTIYAEYKENIEKNKPGSPVVYNDIKRMRGKDFDLLDIKFYCTTFNSESHSASFSLEIGWNEKTSALSKSSEILLPISQGSTKTVNSMIGINTEWIEWESDTYSSTRGLKVTNDKDRGKSSTTFTINNLPDYPEKANTWPVRVTVTKPSAYLFITFAYPDEARGDVHEAYVLEYTYDEYMTDATKGAIPNKKAK